MCRPSCGGKHATRNVSGCVQLWKPALQNKTWPTKTGYSENPLFRFGLAGVTQFPLKLEFACDFHGTCPWSKPWDHPKLSAKRGKAQVKCWKLADQRWETEDHQASILSRAHGGRSRLRNDLRSSPQPLLHPWYSPYLVGAVPRVVKKRLG